jgi:uncharacterized protein
MNQLAFFILLVTSTLVFSGGAGALARGNGIKGARVLVYTKNGKGYVHDNIPSAVACIQKMGREQGFSVTVSDQPSTFTDENLRQFAVLIFASTNNDVFDTDAQRLAFRRYIEAGGGFVGIHSVLGTERNWLWFKKMMGGTFAWHPHFQPLKISVIAAKHPSVAGLPLVWEKQDECYFIKEMSPGPTVVMAHDLASVDAKDSTETARIRLYSGQFTALYPAAWYYEYDGGHTWCTALGHAKEDYTDPVFVQHLLGGIQYVAGLVTKIDYRNAWALMYNE